MKKLFFYGWFAVLAVFGFMACSEQGELDRVEVVKPEHFVQVCLTMDAEASRASLNDGESIRWNEGDKIRYVGVTNSGASEIILTSEHISNDGYSASFQLPISDPTQETTGFFLYNWHLDNEFAFTKSDASNAHRNQSEAGVMNANWLFLHSGTSLSTIPANSEHYALSMKIVGTIFRVIPYTETYNDEQILSVMMQSNSDLIGTVRYSRTDSRYESPLWANAKYLEVALDEPFSLEGVTSREKSKGIYLPVPATAADIPLDGYQYVVTTDQATYTFDAMDQSLAVGENTLKNVFLKLENGRRLGNDDFKGYVYYEGGPGNAVVAADVTYTNSIGYTVARVSNIEGTEWTTCEAKDRHEFLYNATYTYYDTAGNEVPEADSWLKVGFSEFNICHWCLTTEANPFDEDRQLVVKGVLSAPVGYVMVTWSDNLTPKQYEYTFTVTQQGKNAKKKITFAGDLAGEKVLEATAQTNVDLGYWLAYLNDQPFNGEANYALYPTLKCISKADYDAGNFDAAPCSWMTANLQQNDAGVVTDCRWKVNVTENTEGVARQGVIMQTWDNELYDGQLTRVVFITQKAAASDEGDVDEGGTLIPEGACPYTYEIYKRNGNPIGTIWGYNPNTVGTGNQIEIQQVKKEGVAVELTEEIAAEVVAYACRFYSERPETGWDHKQLAAEGQFKPVITLINAQSSQIFVDFESGSQTDVITRFVWYGADGTEQGYWYIYI